MARKASRCRQRIEIVRINCEVTRQINFSKPRVGLFKSASELCTLCDVETAIVVFSLAGKVFSYGHLRVDFIVERFLANNDPPRDADLVASVNGLNQQYRQELSHLETEKNRAHALQQLTSEARQEAPWWEAPIEEMGFLELQQLGMFVEDLKKNMEKCVDDLKLWRDVLMS